MMFLGVQNQERQMIFAHLHNITFILPIKIDFPMNLKVAMSFRFILSSSILHLSFHSTEYWLQIDLVVKPSVTFLFLDASASLLFTVRRRSFGFDAFCADCRCYSTPQMRQEVKNWLTYYDVCFEDCHATVAFSQLPIESRPEL
jgi:hypothetical protein